MAIFPSIDLDLITREREKARAFERWIAFSRLFNPNRVACTILKTNNKNALFTLALLAE